MKLKNFLFFTLITLSASSSAQLLSLGELTSMANKENWETVDRYLMSKGWTYFDSENEESYKKITWSFKKANYDDRAQGWFYLFTIDGLPSMVSYTMLNKKHYLSIGASLPATGYKLVNSTIENGEIYSTYRSNKYLVVLTSMKTDHLEWDDASLTAYNISVIKSGGVFDKDNGRRVETDDEGKVRSEFSLVDGNIHGEYITYDNEDTTKTVGQYVKGKPHGKFRTYNSDGELIYEYNMENGKRQGVTKYFINGKVFREVSFANDELNGKWVESIYNDDGILELITERYYKAGELDGPAAVRVFEGGKESLVGLTNYQNGVKHGFSMEFDGDSLIFCEYSLGKLNGPYKIYLDVNSVEGKYKTTDTTKMNLLFTGQYERGNKTGTWSYYNFSGTLTEEGSFISDKRSGSWRYYYSKYRDEDGQEANYSGKLFLIENYKDGELDGPCYRYSMLERHTEPCKGSENPRQNSDSCYRFKFHKISEEKYYKAGKLNGSYSLQDSANRLLMGGSYDFGVRTGPWLEWDREKFEKGNYVNGEKNGEWIRFYDDPRFPVLKMNYSNGLLHGQSIKYNNEAKPEITWNYQDGKISEIDYYNEVGYSVLAKFELFNKSMESLKCRQTLFFADSIVAQEYWIPLEDETVPPNFMTYFSKMLNGSATSGRVGYKDGDYKLFDSHKRLLKAGVYYKESKENWWTEFYYDQGVKKEELYSAGSSQEERFLDLNNNPFSGQVSLFHIDQGTKEEVRVKNGLRHGKTIISDLTSKKVISKMIYENGLPKN